MIRVLPHVEAAVKLIIKVYPQVHAFVKLDISQIQAINANYARINAKHVLQHLPSVQHAWLIEF